MTVEQAGGGSSAVAASSHAACPRFRGTDPLITGLTRRTLAREVGFADTSGSIPQARWMRAMTFERLVRDESFAGRVATRTVGELGLDRPREVVTVDAHGSVDATLQALADAHERAVNGGAVTLVFQLALPFVGFEDTRATDVKPDFALIAPSTDDPTGSWLVVGDAKDYERVRSRIDDTRMLKGFLQVAVGLESARAWSRLPKGMSVHTFGVLAVPRNAFLQPDPVVENLHDYREEVRLRIDERRREAEASTHSAGDDLKALVEHLDAVFDPAACTTCTLFSFCRDELRRSDDPHDLLIEIGVARDVRRHALGLVDGVSEVGSVPASTAANIAATLAGTPQLTGQRRVDQAGAPGTVNVVIAKSDAAALGVHGIGVQRVTAEGRGDWEFTTFDDPQSPETRRLVMRRIGAALNRAMREQRTAASAGESPDAVHLVVPDKATADVLASIADNLAGVELMRLRWERDIDQGRPPLTYDGEPATVPRPVSEVERTAIALLLEDDRSRAFKLRCPIIDLRALLTRHIVAGGPAANAGRLDYLVGWAEATESAPIDHRAFGDMIEASDHTPGARLANRMSDAIHEALVGKRGKHDGAGAADPELYTKLVTQELTYKAETLERGLDALEAIGSSTLRDAYREIESNAQDVWRRRLQLHASDLVRFGRTYRPWRNSLVPMLESDVICASQLLALANPQASQDMAADAGNRSVAFATVVSVDPLELELESRRIVDGSRVVMVMRNGAACVEEPGVWVDSAQAGSFKIGGLAIGPLSTAGEGSTRLRWDPLTIPVLDVGDRLVIADFAWFSELKGNSVLPVAKPKPDATSAPKSDCDVESYDADPQKHRWCCRSHERSEAEFSDELARRRARGELNPERWPPVRDGDAFEVSATGAAAGNAFALAPQNAPDHQTMDDLE